MAENFSDNVTMHARPTTSAAGGVREATGVMAIPAEIEDTPLNGREPRHLTCHEEMDIEGRFSTEEDPIINVRGKGKGKPINVYSDNEENVSVPVCPTTSDSPASENYSKKHASEPPDFRICRKRHISPNMPKPVDVLDASCLPRSSQSQDFSCQEDIKPTLNLSYSEKHPILPKKKRPDSPMKLHESRRKVLKKLRHKESVVSEQPATVISEEVMLMVLFKLREQGITINGQKYEVHLVPVQDVPQDKSYLEQHDFSPGSQQENNGGNTFHKEKEEQAMPTITEDAEDHILPEFVRAKAEQFADEKLQPPEPDGPLDLSFKGDKEESQETFKDDAGLDEPPNVNPAEVLELMDQEHPLDYSMQHHDRHDMSTYTEATSDEDFVSNGVSSTDPGTVDDHDDQQAHEEAVVMDDKEDEDASKAVGAYNDNLPSLTEKTGNMSLASCNFGGQEVQPKSAQQFVVTPDMMPIFIAKLIELKKAKQASQAQLGQASVKLENPTEVTQQPDTMTKEQAFGATVPNLVNLDMTENDGTLKTTKNDKVKDLLFKRLANKNKMS